jgi:MFS superfamily sulfate permease-like transporter
LPPVGLPGGFTGSDVASATTIAFACFVLIIAQSAATSRSFAAKHGERVDINRDLVGLSGASLAAGLTGTFVVNGNPTKTEILDEQKGRTQVANMTMSAVALLFVVFLTSLLTNMPVAVLAGIVFMIGLGLIDVAGLRRIRSRRMDEFVIACVTAVVVFAIGVEQGIVLAIVLSLIEVVRRAYHPSDFVVGEGAADQLNYTAAAAGVQSRPGLVIFRFDAALFYANATQFTDDVKTVVEGAPTLVRWLVLDCSSVDDVDYSAGLELTHLITYAHQGQAELGLAHVDDAPARDGARTASLTTSRRTGSSRP